jgi:hypothetical protein
MGEIQLILMVHQSEAEKEDFVLIFLGELELSLKYDCSGWMNTLALIGIFLPPPLHDWHAILPLLAQVLHPTSPSFHLLHKQST